MSDKIYLRQLESSDATDTYVNWMNDHEVNQFLESRFQHHTLLSITEFIEQVNSSQNDYLFGIFLTDSDKHIGNIKIGDINKYHKYAEVGIIIGNKNYWGKGYASLAIKQLSKYAFETLNLNYLTAGMYSENSGSFKAFKKAGFKQCAVHTKRWLLNGKYCDGFELEYLKDDYLKENYG